jgi:Tetratricopeptide repeat
MDEATASELTAAGIDLVRRGRLQAARDAFERALSIDEAALGPDHPKVADDCTNLGNVLNDLDR